MPNKIQKEYIYIDRLKQNEENNTSLLDYLFSIEKQVAD